MSHPQLQAVIEAPLEVPEFVGVVPERPWPARLRLHRETAPEHIGLVVAQLAVYGRGNTGPAMSLASLTGKFPGVAPGGLAAVLDGIQINPSCCCGLESWRDWQRLLTDGSQPWLGHDPSPWVEVQEVGFVVWSDGGLGESREGAMSIRFTPDELRSAIQVVERDLVEFLEPLRRWAASHGPASAEELVASFSRAFVDRPNSAA